MQHLDGLQPLAARYEALGGEIYAPALASCWILDGVHGGEIDRNPESVEKHAGDAGLAPDSSLASFARRRRNA